VEVANHEFNAPVKQLETIVESGKLVIAALTAGDSKRIETIGLLMGSKVHYPVLDVNELDSRNETSGDLVLLNFDLVAGNYLGGNENLLLSAKDEDGKSVLLKFYSVPSYESSNHKYSTCNWVCNGAVTYKSDSIRWLDNDLIVSYGTEQHLLKVKYSKGTSKINGVKTLWKLTNPTYGGISSATTVKNFIGFEEELGDNVVIVSWFNNDSGRIRSSAISENYSSSLKDIDINNSQPGKGQVLSSNLKLEEWSSLGLSYLDLNSRRLYVYRYSRMQKYGSNGLHWALPVNAPVVPPGVWDFEPIHQTVHGVLVHLDAQDRLVARFTVESKDPQKGDSYVWPEGHSGIIAMNPAQCVSIASGWAYGTSQQNGSNRVFLAMSLRNEPTKIKVYELINHTQHQRLDYAIQTRHLFKSLMKEYGNDGQYDWAKTIGQVSETLGEYDAALEYYEICLQKLDPTVDKKEYSYIKAHLITCKFLALADDDKDVIENVATVVANSGEIKSNELSGTSPAVNQSVEVKEIQTNSLRSRNWLKRVGQKIQSEPKIKNSVEGTRKINQALALINQWQDEIIPREGFEFIDEQLGVLTNLIALVQGNELSIDLDVGKFSFGDPRFEELLDNAEAVRQLGALEGKEFTEEELERVALSEIEIEAGVTFSSTSTHDNLSGYYRLVKWNLGLQLPLEFENPEQWIHTGANERAEGSISSDCEPMKRKASLYRIAISADRYMRTSQQEFLLEECTHTSQGTVPGSIHKWSGGRWYSIHTNEAIGSIDWGAMTIAIQGKRHIRTEIGPAYLDGKLCNANEVGNKETNDSDSVTLKFEVLPNKNLKLQSSDGHWHIFQKVRDL